MDGRQNNNNIAPSLFRSVFPPRASPPFSPLSHTLTSHTLPSPMPAYVAVALTAAALGASWGARAKLLHAAAVVLSAAQVRGGRGRERG